MFTQAELAAKTKSELQIMAEEAGLDGGGTKDELVTKILANQNQPKFESGDTFKMEQLASSLSINSVFYNTETNKRYRKLESGWDDLGIATI